MSATARLRRLAHMVAFAALATSVVATVGWAWGRSARVEERRFPHEKHARLFPVCETCHRGITTADSATSYPSTSSCADCHDGTRHKRVDWDGPKVAPSNLVFSHVTHERASEKATPALDCRSCHATGASAAFMAVGRATPAVCLGCHAHKANGHLENDTPCARCHAPLSRATRLSDSTVAAISIPDGHRRTTYLTEHGSQASADPQRCAVCHARESCARCHPNAGEIAQRTSMGADARVARALRGRSPMYFKPLSHDAEQWSVAHGDSAGGTRPSCANCHAQPSCRTCHIGGSASRQISRLARPDRDGASGVRLQLAPLKVGDRTAGFAFPHTEMRTGSVRAMPPGTTPVASVAALARTVGRDTLDVVRDTLVRSVRVHPPDIVDRHGALASSGRLNCMGCHEERTCSTCHNGGSRRRFHAFNFVSRHAASAAGRERDCSSCHNTETFCRECHRGQGREARGTGDVAYHDRQPLWFQQHGQAARQEMQSCASCHQQRDCMRCHSDLGLKVNPHGPGFDAARMAKRNRQVCLACHLNDPLRARP